MNVPLKTKTDTVVAPSIGETLPTVASISDAMSKMKLKFQTFDARLHARISPIALSGPAFTVRTYPGATWAVEMAIEKAKPGDVLVIDGGAYTESVLMGGLMSTRASKRGIAGAIIDGAIRDLGTIASLDFPIYSTAVTPRNGTTDQIGDWQMPVSCGGIVVNPGDFIVGDDDGIVCIPVDLKDSVLEAAHQIDAREKRVETLLLHGHTLNESWDLV